MVGSQMGKHFRRLSGREPQLREMHFTNPALHSKSIKGELWHPP